MGLVLSLIIVVALLCSWLAFLLFQIPLPLSRTGIFFVPLVLLVIGIGAVLPSASRLSTALTAVVLSISAIYFIGCLRLSYFKEWKFDADVKETFGVLRRLPNVREIEIDWRYADPLKFYREAFHDWQLPEFAWTEPHVEGKAGYVLYYPTAEDFIRKQNLGVIYRGKLSDVAVAVRR